MIMKTYNLMNMNLWQCPIDLIIRGYNNRVIIKVHHHIYELKITPIPHQIPNEAYKRTHTNKLSKH